MKKKGGKKKAHKPLRTLEAELVLAAWKVELAATVKADGALLLEVVKRSHCLQKERGGKGERMLNGVLQTQAD